MARPKRSAGEKALDWMQEEARAMSDPLDPSLPKARRREYAREHRTEIVHRIIAAGLYEPASIQAAFQNEFGFTPTLAELQSDADALLRKMEVTLRLLDRAERRQAEAEAGPVPEGPRPLDPTLDAVDRGVHDSGEPSGPLNPEADQKGW